MPRKKKASQNIRRSRKNRTKEEWEEMKRQNPDLGKPKDYVLPPKTNESFERYYQGIGIVPEEEWETFLSTMRNPLPTTFRITGSRSQAQELLKIIKGKYFSELFSDGDESSKVALKPLPWYPDELAWQLDLTRKQIKNDSTLQRLHAFLISETESGNISRQEAVSMLPPLLMDIQPHHKILDMCAAPGSKTAQLIEMLHSDENVPVPDGFVVANDADNKRCYLMTHQVKRIQSPNCMIINHDARCLPNMVVSNEEDAEFVKYDRILCDVPCSGDGTMRKNPDIWSKWNVNGAYNLHKIQKKVLQRGLELLAVGGRLVYSTCSLNPVEDEAVILTLIKKCEGTVEVEDVSDKLTGLKYSKGTYSWKVMNKKGDWYERVDQAPGQFQNCWDDTMYPPIITEAQDAKLERCIRILPHQQNTGAFFIAVLTKTRELPWLANRPQRRVGPVINPKVKEQPSTVQKRTDGTQYFSFGIRHKYAKCNICDILLQGKNDYHSHKEGKKHRAQLELLARKKEAAESASTEIANTENISETEKAISSQTVCSLDSKEINESGLVSESRQNDTENNGRNLEEKSIQDSELTVNGKAERSKIETVEVKGEVDIVETGDIKENVDTVETGQDKGDVESVNMEAGGDTQTDDTVKKQIPAGPSVDAEVNPPPAKKPRTDNSDGEQRVYIQGYKEDPFLFCSPDDPIWPNVKQYYDISDDFAVDQLMYRNMKRVLYYVSKPLRNLVMGNDDRVKFINLGVKCFSNAPSPLVPECDYRLSQEGMLAIQHYIRGRRVTISKQDVITLLSQENPFICRLTATAQEYVHALDPGSTIFHFKPSESDPEPNVEIIFCGWRGKTSVRSFVGKYERAHYLRMCGEELSDIQAKVRELKTLRDMTSASGTDTPTGVPSGDEEEVEQWNKDQEAPRGPETDEAEETPLGSPVTLGLAEGDSGEENGGASADEEEDETDYKMDDSSNLSQDVLPSDSIQDKREEVESRTEEST